MKNKKLALLISAIAPAMDNLSKQIEELAHQIFHQVEQNSPWVGEETEESEKPPEQSSGDIDLMDFVDRLIKKSGGISKMFESPPEYMKKIFGELGMTEVKIEDDAIVKDAEKCARLVADLETVDLTHDPKSNTNEVTSRFFGTQSFRTIFRGGDEPEDVSRKLRAIAAKIDEVFELDGANGL